MATIVGLVRLDFFFLSFSFAGHVVESLNRETILEFETPLPSQPHFLLPFLGEGEGEVNGLFLSCERWGGREGIHSCCSSPIVNAKGPVTSRVTRLDHYITRVLCQARQVIANRRFERRFGSRGKRSPVRVQAESVLALDQDSCTISLAHTPAYFLVAPLRFAASLSSPPSPPLLPSPPLSLSLSSSPPQQRC